MFTSYTYPINLSTNYKMSVQNQTLHFTGKHHLILDYYDYFCSSLQGK